MSGQLVAEVLNHAPRGLSLAQRLVLVAIAEQCRGGHRTRVIPRDDLCRVIDRGPSVLSAALAGLERDHGLVVRRAITNDRDGRPVYARAGQATTYMLPEFSAPDGCRCQLCTTAEGPESHTLGGSGPSDPRPGEGPGIRTGGSGNRAGRVRDSGPHSVFPVDPRSARTRGRDPAPPAATPTPAPLGSHPLPECDRCGARAGDPPSARMRESREGGLLRCECRTPPARLRAVR